MPSFPSSPLFSGYITKIIFIVLHSKWPIVPDIMNLHVGTDYTLRNHVALHYAIFFMALLLTVSLMSKLFA
jgi:hypothetical protein